MLHGATTRTPKHPGRRHCMFVVPKKLEQMLVGLFIIALLYSIFYSIFYFFANKLAKITQSIANIYLLILMIQINLLLYFTLQKCFS